MLQVGMAADLKRQTSTDHILAEEFSLKFIFIAHWGGDGGGSWGWEIVFFSYETRLKFIRSLNSF